MSPDWFAGIPAQLTSLLWKLPTTEGGGGQHFFYIETSHPGVMTHLSPQHPGGTGRSSWVHVQPDLNFCMYGCLFQKMVSDLLRLSYRHLWTAVWVLVLNPCPLKEQPVILPLSFLSNAHTVATHLNPCFYFIRWWSYPVHLRDQPMISYQKRLMPKGFSVTPWDVTWVPSKWFICGYFPIRSPCPYFQVHLTVFLGTFLFFYKLQLCFTLAHAEILF